MKPARVVASAVAVFLAAMTVPVSAACFGSGCAAALDAFSYRTEYLWPSQRVAWTTSAYVDKGVAGPEEGPFYAYLVEAPERATRVPRVDGATRLGGVETAETGERRLLEVSVSFSVPADAALGSYVVEVCNDPCDRRLGYLGATAVEIVAGDLEARLTKRIDEVSGKLRSVRASMSDVARRTTKRSIKSLTEQIVAMEEKLDERLAELAARVTELEAREVPVEKQTETSQSTLALGALMLGLAAFFALLRGRARGRPTQG
ncbi:MAG: hypothetical protein ACRDK3_00045 [Actinomycetota bacterium]